MSFCSNCGNQLEDGAKFCTECGNPVGVNNNTEETRLVFEGKLHKCPNCGEVSKAFEMSCPSCGYEFRDAKATESISKLENKLERADSVREKADIIRHFPIPNTKEDILEFLILASSNIDESLEDEISSAWVSKLEQVIQKARLVIKDKNEIEKIESQYQDINKRLSKERTIKNVKKVGSAIAELALVFPQVIIITAWLISIFILLPLCRVNLDSAGYNTYQLLIMLDIIVGAIFVPILLRKDSVLPKSIVASGIILSFIFIIPLCRINVDNAGYNSYQLILFLEIVCSVIILFRTLKYDKKVQNSITVPNGISLVICLFFNLVFIVVYIIGALKIPVMVPSISYDFKSPTISNNEKTDATKGIYTYEIRNYVGKNLASVGEIYGDKLIDKYGCGKMNINIMTEDGVIIPIDDDKIKKKYTVIDQNIAEGSSATIVCLRDDNGKPYSSLVDYQSYDEILLYVSPIGETGYLPEYTVIEPTLDKHIYHIRDYTGRNAAAIGETYASECTDKYGPADLKIVFTSEDGSYIDTEDINVLKQYIVTGQDLEPNKELIIEYLTDNKGKEYGNLISSQNYEEINLKVRHLPTDVIEKMPVLEEKSEANNDYIELTIKYKVIGGGEAEITGFAGDGNHATIDKKIDGHEVVSIGDSAFKDCTTLESVMFWADVDRICDYAFAGCTSLKKISIPNDTKYIGKHAFDGCTELSDLTIWGSPEIDDYAFAGCVSINDISISMHTKRVGGHAFDGCTNLEKVTIWDDDTVIEKDAFANCPKLKDRPIQE